jgi:hypothetical protein
MRWRIARPAAGLLRGFDTDAFLLARICNVADGSAPHVALSAQVVELGSTAHRAALVPNDQVVDAPAMRVNEMTLRVAHMFKRQLVRRLPKMLLPAIHSRTSVDDYVAHVDADPELDTAIFGNLGIAIGHSALDFHGAARGVDSARKFDQGTVTVVLTIRPATSAARMAASLRSMRASITTDRKTFRFRPQAVIVLHCNICCNAPRRIDPKGSNRRRMKLSGGSTRSDKSVLGTTMASDDKKIKTNPASKNESLSKDKSDSGVDTSEAEGAKIADAAPSGYSRGEGQKPVSKAYKDNWNAIFAKKKKR